MLCLECLDRFELVLGQQVPARFLNAGFDPDWAGSPYRLLAYTSLQERATQVSHANTARLAGAEEPLLQKVLARLAGDEARHCAFYRDAFALALAKSGDYDRALKSLETLSQSPRDDIRKIARYDLGNLHMRQAKRIFTERLNHFAPRLQVQWQKLSLSSANTRWGTASADGAIRLNWRLVHFKMDVIDYVVAHELSHLRVMDHSPLFWETVRTVVPDYAHRRAQLRDEALPQWA